MSDIKGKNKMKQFVQEVNDLLLMDVHYPGLSEDKIKLTLFKTFNKFLITRGSRKCINAKGNRNCGSRVLRYFENNK